MRLSRIRGLLNNPADTEGLTYSQLNGMLKLFKRRTGAFHVICEVCSCITVEDSASNNNSGDHLCPDCAEEHFRCYSCDSWTHNDNAEVEGHEVYCPDCYSELPSCDRCNSVEMEESSLVETSEGEERWCETCCSNDAAECDGCGVLTQIREMNSAEDQPRHSLYCENCWSYCEEHDVTYRHSCPECDEDEEDESKYKYLLNYQDKVEEIRGFGNPHAHIKVKRSYRYVHTLERYFGIELELEFDCEIGSKDHTAEGVAEELYDKIPNSITCKDVSIAKDVSDRTGFEVKTRPDTFEAGLTELKAVCEFALSNEREFYAHDTSGRCGLHVHVSRSSINLSQEIKLYRFMNNPKNKLVILFAMRRYNVGYAKVNSSFKVKDLLRSAKGRLMLNNDRTEILNFTHETVEFRGGKATLKYESLVITAQFISALLDFTSPAESSTHSGQKEFLHWLRSEPKNHKLYKELIEKTKELT